MLFEQLSLPFYYLSSKSEICNFQHPIIHQYITRLNIPMHEVELMQLLKCVQNLREVVPHNNLTINEPLFSYFIKIIYQISFVAKLEHDVDDVFVSDDVLNTDDVLVLP